MTDDYSPVSGDAVAATEDPPPAPDAPVEPARPRHRRSARRIAIEWVVIVAAAVAVSFLMRAYVIQTFFIPSASMEPTLHVGDRIIVSKLSVELGTINRGDIVVFKAPPAEHCGDAVSDLVKRVIGLPGEHLMSVGDVIKYAEPSSPNTWHVVHETWTHIEPLGTPIGSAHHPVVVPANSYFVMGDNHPDSCDSRFWGSVPRGDIIGKVFLRIWPLSRFGFL
ncbi:MAG TPA: signal peptidase I [Acidimicrobiales bacterium]|nr:signal peptidase I [Acidimicrobiales bacterium]